MSWEYKTFKLGVGGFFTGGLEPQELENYLNDLGAQGWELVAIFDTNIGNGRSNSVIATLKRPKQT